MRELLGQEALEDLIVEDNQTGKLRKIPARALFVFIGAEPSTGWLSSEVALDEHGFVLTGPAVAVVAARLRVPDAALPRSALETACLACSPRATYGAPRPNGSRRPSVRAPWPSA